ncbi:MAG TPA: DNA replication and repair protein RecF [Polyangiaceae bacterium]|nr:DNA replication and repair protein RecF [Polyangiaceae bacterium]
MSGDAVSGPASVSGPAREGDAPAGLVPEASSAARDFARLLITRLRLKDFRNVNELSLEPAPRFNVISGDNGQGKTSLLEAIYALCTSRSFRTDRMKELPRTGSAFARVDAELCEGDQPRTQRLTLSGEGRAMFIDEQRASRLSEYATRTPVIVFHPGDLDLTMGGATARRDLLDRVGLFSEPGLLDDRRRYRQAVRERQKVLEVRGERAPELEAYETLIARHGSRLAQSRAAAARELARTTTHGFRRLAAAELRLEMEYRTGGSLDEDEFRAELVARRASDRRRHTSSFGPHKDELVLFVDGRPARKSASQGQHRILALSLKLGELAAIESARSARPLLLLDDVSSELDPSRIGAVQAFLRDSQSQVFVTTTRSDLFQTPGAAASERRDFRLRAGVLEGF